MQTVVSINSIPRNVSFPFPNITFFILNRKKKKRKKLYERTCRVIEKDWERFGVKSRGCEIQLCCREVLSFLLTREQKPIGEAEVQHTKISKEMRPPVSGMD